MDFVIIQGGPVSPMSYSFLFPDAEERASGKVRVSGVLVEPKGDKSDYELVELLKKSEAMVAEDVEVTEEEDEEEKKLGHEIVAMWDKLPSHLFHHQWLHQVEMIMFPVMEHGVDAQYRDTEIRATEEAGEDVRRLKHRRKIFRDGSALYAVHQYHNRMVVEIAEKGVVRNPSAWPGYSAELVAYAICLLRESMKKLASYRGKRAAMGFGRELEYTGHYEDLLHAWKTETV